MTISVLPSSIPDVLIIEPKVYSDTRGFFLESFNKMDFENAIGYKVNFVQDNHSCSNRGTLRGLHYQVRKTQAKLVRVVKGIVFDVAVDLRINSPSFGHYVGIELSAENKKQLWIPEGFAHGFMVLSDSAEFLYKTSDYWDPDSEQTLLWNDPIVGIDWPKIDMAPILSQKDMNGLGWDKALKFNENSPR